VSVSIAPAHSDDAEALFSLLKENNLPTDGLLDHLKTTVAAHDADRIIGSAGVELYGDDALLRSVVVARDWQGQRLGAELTKAALLVAESNGASTVYLLTTTAENYFPKFGFERISRSDVPESVQRSVEFVSACPSTATAMRKRL
jgi:amino-acid N-acetyltransferase